MNARLPYPRRAIILRAQLQLFSEIEAGGGGQKGRPGLL